MSIKHIRVLLGVTTILGVGLGASAPALAEAVAPVKTADAPADEGGVSSGDIVVTAQRREELARDVPISITAVTGETLIKSGVTSTLDLGKVAPGVELPLYGAFVLPSIRGVSANATAVGDSPSIAVYIDGVYQSSVSGLNTEMPDAATVQILKGPQGSLYGQNAAGGAIIIDTVAPSFTWKGQFSASYGNKNDVALMGYIAGPLSQTVAFEASGSYHRRDGFNRDLLRGGYDEGLRSSSGRAKLLWQPSDTFSLLLTGYYNRHSDTGVYSNAPLNGNSIGNAMCRFQVVNCGSLPLASQPYTYSTNTQAETLARSYGFSGRAKLEVGEIGTLSTVTAYNNTRAVDKADSDGTPVNLVDFTIVIPEHDFVQEVNFASHKFGSFTVNAGLFYLDKVENYSPYYANLAPAFAPPFTGTPSVYPNALPTGGPGVGGFFSGSSSRYQKKSYAAYMEVLFDITPQLTLSAAGRYSYEKATAANTPLFGYFPAAVPTNVTPLADPRGSFTFKKFTPSAVLRYKPDGNNTLYASYSQGFKSGYVPSNNLNGCAPSPACIAAPVKPEVVDAFEVGYKGKIAGILDLSLAAFHYNYKNIQVFVFTPPNNSIFLNAASGKIDGFEFDASLRASSDLTLRFAGSYLDAKYKSFPAASVFNPSPTGFGNVQTTQNVSGNPLMRTPKWTLTGSVDYKHDIPAGEFALFLSSNYNGGLSFDVNNRIRQSAYAKVDGEISFAPSAIPGARLIFWGKNLTNKATLQSVLESAIADAVSFAAPRQYGVKVEYRF